jgi:tripartite-type tricarboxylate transporter receptor subunit TctC
MSRSLNLIAALIGFGIMASSAAAQSYPTKPITIVVGYGAGGTTDTGVRHLAQKLAPVLGVPVIVENMPGASGNIALENVVNASPDGYRLLVHSVGIMNKVLLPELPYEGIDKLQPVAPVWQYTATWFAGSSAPFNDMKGLVAYGKQHPGELNFAQLSTGAGLVIGKLLKDQGIEAAIIPYKGTSDSFQAMLSGEVQISLDGLNQYLGAIKEGKVKALMYNGLERHPLLPSTPSASEQGLADLSYQVNMGMFSPVGVPAEAVRKLNAAVNEVLKMQATSDVFSRIGSRPLPGPAEVIDKVTRDEIGFWNATAKAVAGSAKQ